MREKDKMHIRENVQAMYIFELLMGWLDRSILTPEQDSRIENVFAEGAAVNRLYGEMLDAYGRLSQRLHAQGGHHMRHRGRHRGPYYRHARVYRAPALDGDGRRVRRQGQALAMLSVQQDDAHAYADVAASCRPGPRREDLPLP